MMDQRIQYEDGIVNVGDDSRIIKCMRRALAGENLKIAFLGGSITQGSLSSTPQLCYAYRTFDWWQKNFPTAQMTYINAGIGGTTSHLGVGRVEEEVLSHKPDFMIVEFSVNDPDTDPHFQETYESLVRRILQAEWKPALLLVHNVRYDDGENAEAIHRPVGAHYNLPSVSMKPTIFAKVSDGTVEKRSITPDDLHPNDLGHEMVAGVITYFLQLVKEKAESQGAKKDCGGVYDGLDSFLPLPAPITASTYENAVRRRNDVLVPDENNGFEADPTLQTCVADCFKKGWNAREKGAKITFTVECSNLAVQYRKTVRKPAPIALLIVDGDREHAVVLDANFRETWGDCLYLETIMEHGTFGKHKVEIEIVETHEDDAESFYLVSLITA